MFPKYPFKLRMKGTMILLSVHNAFIKCCFFTLPLVFFTIQAAVALPVPELKGHVNDNANLLSPETRQLLEHQLRQVASQDSSQVILLTITSLGKENLEQYALKVAETWAIGYQQFDNGVLLLVAVNDRKIRIETGYGLEGVLTDLVAGRIISNLMVPEFRKKRFDQGVTNGVAAIIATVKGEFDATSLVNTTKRIDPVGWIIAALLGFFFTGIFFRKKQKIAACAGGFYGLGFALAAPFIQSIVMILLVAVLGMMSGALVSSMVARRNSTRRSGTRIIFSGHRVDNNSTNSHGMSNGGFSGGGGGFGGGGASGDW